MSFSFRIFPPRFSSIRSTYNAVHISIITLEIENLITRGFNNSLAKIIKKKKNKKKLTEGDKTKEGKIKISSLHDLSILEKEAGEASKEK